MKQTKPHRFGKVNGLALLARRSLPGLCAAAGIVLVLAASDARAQGIPVFDSTNYIQALATVTNTAQQVQQAVMAVQTAQQQLASLQQLTNVNSIGTILSAAQNRDIMNGVTDLTSLASGNTTQLGAIGQQAKQLQSGYQITSSGNSTVDQQYNQLVQQTTGQVATQAAYAQNLQQVAANRTTGLEQLRSALDTASDPKQVMDLQARIAVEQAHLQNDMIKLQAYKMAQDAQNAAAAQNAFASRAAATSATLAAQAQASNPSQPAGN
jgi:type IV secretion system protein VirB5